MGKIIKSAFFMLAMFAALVAAAFAQETTGGLQGTVRDPQGSIIPGATVTIKGVSVGYNRTITANDDGYFRIQELPPGDYTVSVAATGFSMNPVSVRVAVGKDTEVP